MGIWGDGKKKDGEVYVTPEEKHLLSSVKDPKMLQKIEKEIL